MAVTRTRTPKNTMVSRARSVLAALCVAAGVYSACAEPPRPAAAYAPGGSAKAAAAAGSCGLVKRAKRTWVGFGPNMTLDDMVPAGMAAAEVVRALDAAVCGVVKRGQAGAVLRDHVMRLKAQAADGGGFEVTQVLWQDPDLAHARVELHGKGSSARATWLALVVRDDARWKIDSFASR